MTFDTFAHHIPTEEQIERIQPVREAFAALLDVLNQHNRSGSISGRYAALARTSLEESAMWAIKSIVFEQYNVSQG
jgi:hypothetical protein